MLSQNWDESNVILIQTVALEGRHGQGRRDLNASCGVLRFRSRNANRTGIRTVGNRAFHVMSLLEVLVCALAQTRTSRNFSIVRLEITNSTELPRPSPVLWASLSRTKTSKGTVPLKSGVYLLCGPSNDHATFMAAFNGSGAYRRNASGVSSRFNCCG